MQEWCSEKIYRLVKPVTESTIFKMFQVVLTMIPIADIITDFVSFCLYAQSGERWWAFFCWMIMHFNFRFSMLYGIIHPTPEFSRILLMYTPIITMYRLNYILESNKTHDNSDKEEVELDTSASDPDFLPVPQFVGSLYKKEDLQERLRSMLWKSHLSFEKLDWKYKPFIAVREELKFFFVGFLVGPFLTVGASFNLARRVFSKEPEHKGIHRAPLYWKVLCFIEAIFESIPQIILQTYVFSKNDVALWI